jgi:biopolymer transport protein ExbD
MSFGSKREIEQDCDINLASIVDCFTVLITYLLAAGSFISLGMIPAETLVERAPSSVEQPAETQSVPPPEAPKVTVTVEVQAGNKVRFSVWTGNEAVTQDFEVKTGTDALTGNQKIKDYVQNLKNQHVDVKNAVVASDPGVTYGEFISVADLVRSGFKILLANPKVAANTEKSAADATDPTRSPAAAATDKGSL